MPKDAPGIKIYNQSNDGMVRINDKNKINPKNHQYKNQGSDLNPNQPLQ